MELTKIKLKTILILHQCTSIEIAQPHGSSGRKTKGDRDNDSFKPKKGPSIVI